jgi:hypothetical protein
MIAKKIYFELFVEDYFFASRLAIKFEEFEFEV